MCKYEVIKVNVSMLELQLEMWLDSEYVMETLPENGNSVLLTIQLQFSIS